MNKIQDLATAWALLHQQYQTFENYALLIKLVTISIVAVAFIFSHAGWGVFFIVLICWLSEAVWKTFQGRAENDLRMLEKQIHQLRQEGVGHAVDDLSYQAYSRWAEERPPASELVGQYIRGLRQPTVALTYLLLAGLILLAKLSA